MDAISKRFRTVASQGRNNELSTSRWFSKLDDGSNGECIGRDTIFIVIKKF
jgi:hypothetical protein